MGACSHTMEYTEHFDQSFFPFSLEKRHYYYYLWFIYIAPSPSTLPKVVTKVLRKALLPLPESATYLSRRTFHRWTRWLISTVEPLYPSSSIMPSLCHQFLYRGFVYIAGLYIFALFIKPYLPVIKSFIRKHEPYLKSILIDYKPYLNSRVNAYRTAIKQRQPYITSLLNDYYAIIEQQQPYLTSLLTVQDYDYRLIPTLRLLALFTTTALAIVLYCGDCWPVTSLTISLLSSLYIHHRYIGRYLHYNGKSTQKIEWVFGVVKGWIIDAPTNISIVFRWISGKERGDRRREGQGGPPRRPHLL